MLNRRRSENDSHVVEALFNLHDLLNNKGQHWVKGYFRAQILIDGSYVERRCLAGGVRYLTGWGSDLHGVMFELLAGGIAEWPHDVDIDDHEGACIAFNDDDETTWPDVERLIARAIGAGRRIQVPA